jgi:hypothetical protein
MSSMMMKSAKSNGQESEWLDRTTRSAPSVLTMQSIMQKECFSSSWGRKAALNRFYLDVAVPFSGLGRQF